jgi:hypothetical protein
MCQCCGTTAATQYFSPPRRSSAWDRRNGCHGGPALARQRTDKPSVPKFFLYATRPGWSLITTRAEPACAASKNIFTLNHVDAMYGTNYVNIDLLKSDNKGPGRPVGWPDIGTARNQ